MIQIKSEHQDTQNYKAIKYCMEIKKNKWYLRLRELNTLDLADGIYFIMDFGQCIESIWTALKLNILTMLMMAMATSMFTKYAVAKAKCPAHQSLTFTANLIILKDL